MKIIDPEIEQIHFNTSKNSIGGVLIEKTGQKYPFPLENFGDGIIRLLTISIIVFVLENGYLLIDEIDTGLHYETQAKMWKLLMEAAKQLNIKIFATTHSWDCIEAFQEAIEELEDESIGKLFRISNKYGKLRPVEYVSDEIAAAVRQGIEVR